MMPSQGDAAAAAASQQQERRDDVLVAFSVHGLLGASDRAGVASEGAAAGPAAQQTQREVVTVKKGWLSSLNNVVVGDRPETVTL